MTNQPYTASRLWVFMNECGNILKAEASEITPLMIQ
jgi:hypothetical protein